MNLLFIGDIVGPAATTFVAALLPDLKREHAVDLVIANAENCTGGGKAPGYGMDLASIDQLFDAGVDVVTSGNHAWDHPDSAQVLAHPNVLRPLNVPSIHPGKGMLRLDVAGEAVTVVNLADAMAIPNALSVWAAWTEAEAVGTVLVDFHGGDVLQKIAFAHSVDGTAAAVLGTHTHEPTHSLHLLPGGTALVVDVGMTGPGNGGAGMAADDLASWYASNVTTAPVFGLASGPITLGAVLLRIENGRTEHIVRLSNHS